MARNKYPEETIQKILDHAYRLFREKGYDHTTIQDIVDALGMSKGAVYHHFKSKEDILNRIYENYYEGLLWKEEIDPALTGLQQLQMLLRIQLSDEFKVELDRMGNAVPVNPQMMQRSLDATMHDTVEYCLPMVERGMADGSIQTEHPRELTEVLLLLLNVWIGMYTNTRAEFERKLRYLKVLTDAMGAPILDDAILTIIDQYFDRVVMQPLEEQ